MFSLHFIFFVVFGLSISLQAEELIPAVSVSDSIPSSEPIVGVGPYYIPPKDWTIGYGYPSGKDDFPSYFERDMILWMNIARIGQKWWRDQFLKPINPDGTYKNVFESKSYPSTYPGYWNLNLNRVARGHSYDQAVNCYSSGGGHSSCNGTSFAGRLYSYLASGEGWLSEIYDHVSPGCNITRGFYSIAAWMCDGFHSPSCNAIVSSCPKDENAGHRRNIMTYSQQMGCGVVFPQNKAPSDSLSHISTCDGLKNTKPYFYNRSIAIGSHTLDPYKKSTHFRFYMVYNGSTFRPPALLFNGKSYKMSTAHKGKYGTVYVSQSFKISKYKECKPYYFQAGSERYPYVKKKVFFTYGIGNCTQDAGDGKEVKAGYYLNEAEIAVMVIAFVLAALIAAAIVLTKFVFKLW